MLRAYLERPGSLPNSHMDANGATCRTAQKSVSELVPEGDTIASRLPSGSIMTLTCGAVKLTSVLYESLEHLGTVGADARGRYLAPP